MKVILLSEGQISSEMHEIWFPGVKFNEKHDGDLHFALSCRWNFYLAPMTLKKVYLE